MSYVSVQIDLDDIETDDLIEEIESREYVVFHKETHKETLENMEDEIHNLYQDFICWKDLGMKDSTFESVLKKFFEITIDMKVL